MRNDMFKVIVERPRRGVGYFRTLRNEYRAARFLKFNEDNDVVDEFYGKMPMRSKRIGYDGKELNENLNPLQRFITSKIGERWDNVYSEICSKIDRRSTVQQHIHQHIKDFIVISCYEEKGEIYNCNNNYYPYYKKYPVNGVYVDPKTGIICSSIPKTKYKHKAVTKSYIKITNKLAYVWIKGFWFRIELKHRSELEVNPRYVGSYLVYKEAILIDCVFELDYFPVSKKSANKKELKDYNLN